MPDLGSGAHKLAKELLVSDLQEALEQDAGGDEVLRAPHCEREVHGAVRQVVAPHLRRHLVLPHAPVSSTRASSCPSGHAGRATGFRGAGFLTIA